MDKKNYPSENQERFIVRLPDGMRDQIAVVAKDNNRSMNAEIVARLQASFPPSTESGAWEKTFPSAALAIRGDAITAQMQHEMQMLKALQKTQLQAKHELLISQVLSLEQQAMNLELQSMQVASEIERADEAGEPKRVSSALKQAKTLKSYISEIEARIVAAKQLTKAAHKEMMAQQTDESTL